MPFFTNRSPIFLPPSGGGGGVPVSLNSNWPNATAVAFTGTNTLTTSAFTVNVGVNTALFALLISHGPQTSPFTSVQWDALGTPQNFTEALHMNDWGGIGVNWIMSLWWLAAPTVGNKQFKAVRPNGSSDFMATLIAFDNVDQTYPLINPWGQDSFAASGSPTTPASFPFTLGDAVNDLTIAQAITGAVVTATNNNQIVTDNTSGSFYSYAAAYGASSPMNASASSGTNWSMVGGEVKAASGGPSKFNVQHAYGADPQVSTPVTTATASSVTPVQAGNFVVGMVSWNGAATATISSITDDKGNSYTVLDKVDNGGSGGFNAAIATFYRAGVANGPTTITVTFATGQPFVRVSWDELHGVSTVDGHSAAYQGLLVTNPSTPSITTTLSNDIIWSFAYRANQAAAQRATQSSGAVAGFMPALGPADDNQQMSQFRIQTSPGSVSDSFVSTQGTTGITAITGIVALN